MHLEKNIINTTKHTVLEPPSPDRSKAQWRNIPLTKNLFFYQPLVILQERKLRTIYSFRGQA